MVPTAKIPETPLRLLLVDAVESDAVALLGALCAAGCQPQSARVANAAALRAALQAQAWDAILCKLRQPGLTALTAFKVMQELGFDLPFIVIADDLDDKAVARVMHGGGA